MDFDEEFKTALERVIPEETDKCFKPITYSDEILVRVCSHPNGEGSFELYAIVPHDEVDEEIVGRDSDASQLPPEVPGYEEFYDDIDRLVEEVTGSSQSDLVFHLMDVLDEDGRERKYTEYATHELTA